MKQEKLIKKYNKQAKMYERNRNTNLDPWRSKIIQSAYGKVLEVGVGAGANFPYYRKDVAVTGVDFSSEMIKGAQKAASAYQINSTFIREDVENLEFEENSFDCIVSTLTLCSYPNPISILNLFNRWCQKDGRILLMEHGLSSNGLISFAQKTVDPIYKKFSGCHGDRDIQKIVNQSDLEIEQLERHWSGILYLIWARANKNISLI